MAITNLATIRNLSVDETIQCLEALDQPPLVTHLLELIECGELVTPEEAELGEDGK